MTRQPREYVQVHSDRAQRGVVACKRPAERGKLIPGHRRVTMVRGMVHEPVRAEQEPLEETRREIPEGRVPVDDVARASTPVLGDPAQRGHPDREAGEAVEETTP